MSGDVGSKPSVTMKDFSTKGPPSVSFKRVRSLQFHRVYMCGWTPAGASKWMVAVTVVLPEPGTLITSRSLSSYKGAPPPSGGVNTAHSAKT